MIFPSRKQKMDASDTIRAKKAKTFYYFQSAANVITQKNANCGTCRETYPSTGTACVVNFPSYDAKLLYLVGKNAALVCSTCVNSSTT
jgi:hypothetical protein